MLPSVKPIRITEDGLNRLNEELEALEGRRMTLLDREIDEHRKANQADIGETNWAGEDREVIEMQEILKKFANKSHLIDVHMLPRFK